MGFILSKFYSKKSHTQTNKLSEQEKVLFEIKQCRDKIKNYIKRLHKDINLNRDKAKDMLKKNEREKAKVFLNKSKMCLTLCNTAEGQLNMIEEQMENIQMTMQQKETFHILEKGNAVLKELQNDVNLERLENISEEMNEIKQSQQEVANFLKNYNISSTEFETEVEDDLDKLMTDIKKGKSENKKIQLKSNENEIHTNENENNREKIMIEN
jgi:charged multivesicular body protein 6